MPAQEPVGLIGLGLLGSALAERLLGSGFPVIGFDVAPVACEGFSAAGGTPADDTADVAQRCRRIILSLPDSEVAARVVNDLLPALRGDSLIIDTTTGDPDEMTRLGEVLGARGVGYMDATIAGSSAQARRGEVLVMVGGPTQHVAACRDVFDAFAQRTMHVGACGSGARMKLIVNLVLGLHRAVLAEGLSFAAACGIDPQLALEVLRASPAYSTVMDTKGEKMLSGDFAPHGRLRQHLKDVRLILASAEQHAAKTPLSEWHADALQALVDRGFGDDDNAGVIRAFE